MEQHHSPQGGDETPRTPHERAADATIEREPGIDELADMLVAVEQRLDDDGWDQPPRIFTLHHAVDGGIDVHGLLAPGKGVHLPTLLEVAADEIRSPEYADRVRFRLDAGYFGLLVSSEVWARLGLEALTTDTSRPLADQPGSVECRLVTIRTIGGQELTYQHVRGRESGFLPSGAQGGRLIDGLRRFMDSLEALRTLPETPPPEKPDAGHAERKE